MIGEQRKIIKRIKGENTEEDDRGKLIKEKGEKNSKNKGDGGY